MSLGDEALRETLAALRAEYAAMEQERLELCARAEALRADLREYKRAFAERNDAALDAAARAETAEYRVGQQMIAEHEARMLIEQALQAERERIANVLRFHAPSFLGMEDLVCKVADDIESGTEAGK